MFWLGDKRGYLSDWVTQRWVQLTGRRVDIVKEKWLQGPAGKTHGIGLDYFQCLAREEGLVIQRNGEDGGLLPSFAALKGPGFSPSQVHPGVVAFYERTSAFDLDAWSEWCGVFRPLGRLLAIIFSRRLQQLNVPLSPLDTSLGITSEIVELVEPGTGKTRYVAWVRQLLGTRNVLYAGSYSVVRVPGHQNPCVKVVFPLPNGNAIVIMKPEAHRDGSFSITSSGKGFGDPGFYFTVYGTAGKVWARYVRALRESIHVFVAEDSGVRANHVLTFWGMTFLRLHYRLRTGNRAALPKAVQGTNRKHGNSS